MRKPFHKLNNSGSTLLTVIICLALVGILGSLMLSVTMTNLQMKLVESKSRTNFYSCEAAMEEIRTGLEELTASKIREVYETDILNNFAAYLATPEDQRNIEIKKKVAEKIIREFGLTDGMAFEELFNDSGITPRTGEIFNLYLSDTDRTETSIFKIISGTGDNIVLKDINVRYTKENYESSITSDIVITLPSFTFKNGAETTYYRMEAPYPKFSLIADGEIKSEHSSGSNAVIGSIYAGKGITVDSQITENHTLTVQGEDIITRGDITAVDTAKISIKGITQADGTIKSPIIWADNLVTKTTSLYTSGFTKQTTLEIDGISLIKDDLTLEGSNSRVSLAGAYVGYSSVHTAEGSAMMINGPGSSLDLLQLKSMVLAGRAHVSVDGVLMEDDILTGESIAFKSNQRAYLIPGRFILGIKHNPITQTDIGEYAVPVIDFLSVPYESTDPFYTNYVDPLHPFKIAAKQTVEGNTSTILRYYYLDFVSGKQADAYLQEYLSKNPAVLNRMEPFSLGIVTLPEGTGELACVGNLMSYDGLEVELHNGLSNSYPTNPLAINPDVELDQVISEMKLDNTVYAGAGVQAETTVGMLEVLYSKIAHLLSLESTRTYKETDKAVEATLLSGGVDFIGDRYSGATGLQYYGADKMIEAIDIINPDTFIMINGNAVINTDINGLVVANGNITINNNVTINGMIISTGVRDVSNHLISGGNVTIGDHVTVNGRMIAANDINLGTNDSFTAANDTSIINIFYQQGEILQNLFRNLPLTINFTVTETAENLVDLSAMISYENWRKN